MDKDELVDQTLINDAMEAGFYASNTGGIGFAGYEIGEQLAIFSQLRQARSADAELVEALERIANEMPLLMTDDRQQEVLVYSPSFNPATIARAALAKHKASIKPNPCVTEPKPDDQNIERECCGTFHGTQHRATCHRYRGKFKPEEV
jgi:hypothetical protein